MTEAEPASPGAPAGLMLWGLFFVALALLIRSLTDSAAWHLGALALALVGLGVAVVYAVRSFTESRRGDG
ncbi:hypothetical protein ACMYYO_14425 [Dermacoccaceae bacterium W4C1]